MLNAVFVIGIVVFALSSVYFYFTGTRKVGLNSAFLVSFVTLISYVLLWQREVTVTSAAGQLIFPTRWLFYGVSCTLLMYEIARLKKLGGGELVQILYLTAIVMLTGFLAAHEVTAVRWIHFVISSVAYLLLVVKILSVRTAESGWVSSYIYFGWTVFPIVFFFAPTGFGLIGAGVANLLYLLLDLFTKIIFNVQLASKS